MSLWNSIVIMHIQTSQWGYFHGNGSQRNGLRLDWILTYSCQLSVSSDFRPQFIFTIWRMSVSAFTPCVQVPTAFHKLKKITFDLVYPILIICVNNLIRWNPANTQNIVRGQYCCPRLKHPSFNYFITGQNSL